MSFLTSIRIAEIVVNTLLVLCGLMVLVASVHHQKVKRMAPMWVSLIVIPGLIAAGWFYSDYQYVLLIVGRILFGLVIVYYAIDYIRER